MLALPVPYAHVIKISKASLPPLLPAKGKVIKMQPIRVCQQTPLCQLH